MVSDSTYEPVSYQRAKAQPGLQPTSEDKLKSKSVLIIEDDEEVHKLLRIRLWELGFEVESAFDGVEGAALVKRLVPDLIILDLLLPEMPGEDVCKYVREGDVDAIRDIPIVMLTAKGSTADKVLGRSLGANAYLVKPFEFEELLGELKRLDLLQ